MSTGRISIFRTLLWAERTPRQKVLRIIMCILAFFAFSSVMHYLPPNYIDGSRSEGTAFVQGETLVILGVLYAMLVQGIRGFTVQPPWLAMALPVRTFRLLFPALLYQTSVAILLGALFGVQRYFAGVEHAFSAPIVCLTVLTAQGYAACLWWTAGHARGLAVFGIGLAGAWFAGVAAAALLPVPALLAIATFLIPCGWASSCLAARAFRGGNVPAVDFTRFALVDRLLHWNQARAASKTAFSSPLWAQVWFEWRRTGWWCAGAFLVYTLAEIAIDVSGRLATGESFTGYDDPPAFLTLLYLVIPALIWLAHVAITKPYRRFVFTRPNTTKRVAAAKMLAALGAAIAGAVFDHAAQGIYGFMLPGDTAESSPGPFLALLDGIVSGARSFGMPLLGLLYGPILVVLIMIPIFIWSLGRFATEVVAAEGPSLFIAFTVLPMVFTLVVLPLAFAYVGLKSRLDTRAYPKPLEVFAALALTAVAIALVLVGRAIGADDHFRNLLEYAAPVLLLLSVLCYGRRTGILTLRNAGVVLLGFAISWIALRTNQLATESGEADLWSATPGFWLVIAFSVFVFYPIMIGCQRLEADRATSSGVPAWAMLFFAPLLASAFLFLGEDWSEGKERT